VNDSSVSTNELAEAAAVQTMNSLTSSQDIISRFPRVHEKTVDHATEAPKNTKASNAARLVLGRKKKK
jgi:hypothetical protein